MDRFAWAWMPVAALLLIWVEPTRCMAQPPVPPSTMPTAINPLANQGGGQLPSLPTSPIVSPGIGSRSGPAGRDLPSALPLPSEFQPPRRTSGSAMGISPYTPGASALATRMTLKPAPFESTDLRFPINLATALRLSDARPLIVAAAQASVWVAEAELTQAKVLWIPDAQHRLRLHPPRRRRPGLQQGHHDRAERRTSSTAVPACGETISTTDAIFQPLVARQVLNSRHWDIQTAKNDALLQTADAYFMVHQYRGMYAGALYTRRARARAGRADRQPEPRPGPRGRGRPGPEHARRPRAAGRLGAAGVARPERQPHAGAPARPPRGGRAAGARPRSRSP